MKCNIAEALKDLEKLIDKKAIKENMKIEISRILTDSAYFMSKIKEHGKFRPFGVMSEEYIRHSEAVNDKKGAMEDKLKKVDKLYSQLVYTKNEGNYKYVNSMLNLFNKITPAQVKYVRSILNENMQNMAGSYDRNTDIIEVLKNPSVKDTAIGIRNTVMAEFGKTFKVEFLPDEVLDLLFSKEAEKRFEFQAAEAIKELEGIKGQQILLHEYVHSVTEKFMKTNPYHPAVKQMNNLFNIAKSKKEEIIAMTRELDLVDTYWSKSVDEFVAEGLSNPQLMLTLLKIEVPGMEKLSVFEEFIKTVVEMLGLTKNKENMYSLLLDSTLAMAYEQGNRAILDSVIVEELGKIKKDQKFDMLDSVQYVQDKIAPWIELDELTKQELAKIADKSALDKIAEDINCRKG